MKDFFAVLSCCSLMYLAIPCSAQMEYHKIKKNILKKNSEHHYQKMYDRYIKFDSSLTVEDYYHLYYGIIFTDLFRPEFQIPEELTEIFLREEITDTDLQQAEKWIELSMKEDFFNPELIWMKCYIAIHRKDQKMYEKWSRHFEGISEAILRSGDGSKQDSPIFLTLKNHDRFVMEIRGLIATREENISESTYFINCEENEFKLKGLYFDAFIQNEHFEEKKLRPKIKIID